MWSRSASSSSIIVVVGARRTRRRWTTRRRSDGGAAAAPRQYRGRGLREEEVADLLGRIVPVARPEYALAGDRRTEKTCHPSSSDTRVHRARARRRGAIRQP